MKKAQNISIVIPVFNEQRHLKACLDSIEAQTIKPNEVIVVDNNSTDSTAQIAKSYPFVKLIKESKQGVVYARNAGFDAANSKLIGRIDADTVLPPNWIERVMEFYKDGFCFNHALTGGCYFYNIRLPRFSGWWQGQIAFRMNRLLLGHYILFGSNMILPIHIWRQVKLKACKDTNIHEDLDLSIHVHEAGYSIEYHETFKVGVKMRRVRSQRSELWKNMIMWPRTLRVHHKWTWVFGWLGAVILYALSPILVAEEYVARLFGKTPLPE